MKPQDIFLAHLAQTSPQPLLIEVARAEGIYLYTPDGKRYVDMISGIGVANLGHCHPAVTEAICKQTHKFLHVMAYGEYVQAPQNDLALLLAKLLPPSLNCCYFVNSGAEANEGALKLAKRFTGRTEIISFEKSYHGSTHGALSVSGNEAKKRAFRPLLPDVRHIALGKMDALASITERTACVIAETVQGDAGVRIPSIAYMRELRQRCTDVGALLILDEIQCGMGRCGSLFAFEQFGIIPDILTLGKALGGGLPIGAFIAEHSVMSVLTHDPALGHITTFGGNPVCCAAAHAALSVLSNKKLLTEADAKGKRIVAAIQHPDVLEIRQIGLMIAVDFDSVERVNRIVKYCKERGVICYWFLSHPHSFRLAPPLIITDEEIDAACAVIKEAIQNTHL